MTFDDIPESLRTYLRGTDAVVVLRDASLAAKGMCSRVVELCDDPRRDPKSLDDAIERLVSHVQLIASVRERVR